MVEILLVVLIVLMSIAFASYILRQARGTDRVPRAQPLAAPIRLPVVNDPHGKCATCIHFDLAEGQALMRQQLPVFSAMVAPFIKPAEVASMVTEVADKGNGVKENVAETPRADIPASCDWHRFGFCSRHSNGLWEGTTRAQRLKNMPDYTPGGVDCHEPRPLS